MSERLEVHFHDHHVTFALQQGDRRAFMQYARTDVMQDINGRYSVRPGAKIEFSSGHYMPEVPLADASERIREHLRALLPPERRAA